MASLKAGLFLYIYCMGWTQFQVYMQFEGGVSGNIIV